MFFLLHRIVANPSTPTIVPENRPLEKEIPIGNHHFLAYVSFRECNLHVFVSFLKPFPPTNAPQIQRDWCSECRWAEAVFQWRIFGIAPMRGSLGENWCPKRFGGKEVQKMRIAEVLWERFGAWKVPSLRLTFSHPKIGGWKTIRLPFGNTSWHVLC